MTAAKNFIDLHCHTAGVGQNSACFISQKLKGSYKYDIYLRAFGLAQADLDHKGDGVVIERISSLATQSKSIGKVVVLALDGVYKDGELDRANTEIYIDNSFVAAEVAKYPNLLYGPSVNPNRSDWKEELERVAKAGAVLIKWLPPIQMIDPSSESYDGFYLKMKELGLPLLTHTGNERSFTRHNDALGDPMLLERPLKLGLTVIAAHSGGNGESKGQPNMDRLVELCREYLNLYADISALTQVNRLGALAKVLGREHMRNRLVYGSDMPLINTPLVTPWPFMFKIGLARSFAIARMDNPWDRDVAIKEALGVDGDVFVRAESLLRLPQ